MLKSRFKQQFRNTIKDTENNNNENKWKCLNKREERERKHNSINASNQVIDRVYCKYKIINSTLCFFFLLIFLFRLIWG